MNPAKKRRLRPVFLILLPVILFLVTREKASWRPRELGRMDGEITALSWSADGRYLAAAAGFTQEWGAPGQVAIWDVRRRKIHKNLKIGKSPVTWLRFSPDGTQILYVDGASVLRACKAQTGETLTEPLQLPDENFAVSPDCATLVIEGDEGVELFRVGDGESKMVLPGAKGSVLALAFSRDGKRVAALKSSLIVNGAPTLEVWNLPPEGKAPEKPRQFAVPKLNFSTSAFLSMGAQDDSIVICADNAAREIALASGQVTVLPAAGVASPDGTRMAMVSRVGAMWWKSGSSQMVNASNGLAPGKALAFSCDSRTLAVGDDGGTITLWRVK